MKSALFRMVLSVLVAFSLAPEAGAGPMLAGGPRPVYGPPGPPPSYDPGVVRIELTGQGPAARTLTLGKGKSAMIELPVDARDIAVSNSTIADVVLRTPRRISVLGLADGDTDAVFFDGMGHPILRLNIRVDQDTSAVADLIARLVPTSHIHVDAVNSSLILSGQAQSAADADKAQQIAAQFADKPEHVLNMVAITGQDQVMVKVRVVEVERSAVKQLGFNMQAVIGQAGGSQWVDALSPVFGVNGALLGGLQGGYSKDTTTQPEMQLPCVGPGWSQGATCPYVVKNASQAANFNAATLQPTAGSNGVNKASAMIQAFEQAGLVRTLAEPNLTSVSGEPAHTLVGGEFPVPTGQDNNGRVTIEFKQFGVGLGFTPIVLSGGRISLKLSVEVSELSNTGSFTLNSGSGSPSVVVPGLGALFRSRDFQSGETELVIIVTPYLVKATSADKLQTPADGLEIASDSQTILLGRLNKVYQAPPDAVAGRSYQGPYGYVIE